MDAGCLQPRRLQHRAGALFCALLLIACAGAAGTVAAAGSPLRERFEATYRKVEERVAAGTLPEAAARQALKLRTGLDHDLVKSRAEVQSLKIRLLRSPDPEREPLADRLVAAGAARERVVRDYLEELRALLTTPASDRPPGESAEGAPNRQENKGTSLNIRSVPEDLSRGSSE